MEQKFTGAHFPQTVVDTSVYFCGMHFALRSVKVHRDLELHSFELVKSPSEVPYLVYQLSVKESSQGAQEPIHHANME